MMNEVFAARLDRFRKELDERGLGAALVTKRENIRYMSGFTGTSASLVITGNRQILITDSRYTEQAKIQSPGWCVIETKSNTHETIGQVLSENGCKCLGFEDSNMVYKSYMELKQKINLEMAPMGEIIEKMRIIKDKNEIDTIRKAVEIADKAFEYILNVIKPGLTEKEVASELEHFMKKNGADGEAFETIVASGSRSSLPHGVASDKRIMDGDVVTLDFGAVYNGYCSDMTRTVFVGEPDEEMKKVYNIVLDAQLCALERVSEGLQGKEIDSVAREYISKAGYGDFFGHGLGHGVGLEVHEGPRLSPRSDTVIENGMTVTVEPGIYLPGKGGVRIEDLVVINGSKPEILTASNKAMTVLTIT
jgi:Xaa-Pro aminopeptidase